MTYLAELKRLGFSKGTTSEVLLSLSLGSEVNVAPMGVRLGEGAELIIKVFAGCRTYDLIRRGARDYVVNITSDPALFYYAIFSKSLLKLKPSRWVSAPRVAGCDAYVEAERSGVSYGRGYLILRLRPIHVEYRRVLPKVYSRAAPAVIETLVYYTKLPYLKKSGKLREAEELLKRMLACAEVVERCTRSRRLRSILRSVIAGAEGIIKGSRK